MNYRGDRPSGSIVGGTFTTSYGGILITLSGTPNISVQKRGTATASTAGRTLNVDIDTGSGAITGLNSWEIDTSADGSFYAAGFDFDVCISAGTVGGISIIGRVVGGFSLEAGAGGSTPPTAAAIAEAVWDEDATGHQTQGTFGQAIGDPGADTDTIFALTNTIAGEIGAAGAGLTALATQASVDVIDGKVDDIEAAVGALNNISTADLDAALATYDGPTHTEMTSELATADDDTLAAIAALNNLSAAEINAEVDTAISDAALASEATVTFIKDQTDKLAFTVTNQIDVNIKSVNDLEVTGSGTGGDPWGPA